MKNFSVLTISCLLFFGNVFCVPSTTRALGVVPTVESLQKKYREGGIVRILIVPGHDDEFGGAEWGTIKEADLTRDLSKKIAEKFSIDPQMYVTVARDNNGYIPELVSYFSDNKKEIETFIKNYKKKTAQAVESGKINIKNQVTHNNAPDLVAYRLYAINKWANENKYDIILHVHFNDYSPHIKKAQGEYGGFSIYTPDPALTNGKASEPLAEAIGERLKRTIYTSNIPVEKEKASANSVIKDFKLISLGSNMTLSVPSVLVEYSYIFESIINKQFFEFSSDIFAEATVMGIYEHLTGALPPKKNLSHTWASTLFSSPKKDIDVLALQYALKELGWYPPAPLSRDKCPITGIFGPCTKSAVQAFQKSEGLLTSGVLTQSTRSLLNTLFK